MMQRLVCEVQIESLARYAFPPRRERSPESRRAWFDYKHTPQATPLCIDLTDPLALATSWPSREKSARDDCIPANANLYDYLLITLSKGDMIRFGERNLRVGDFIGAGHTTHVYRLLDSPEQVVRLPFVTRHLTKRLEKAKRVSHGLKIMKETVTRARGQARSVFLPSECDPYHRYAIAEYVHGTLLAEDFVRHTACDGTAIGVWKNGIVPPDDPARLTCEQREKISDLVAACRALLPSLPPHNCRSMLKHLLWSEAPPREWKLIDTF